MPQNASVRREPSLLQDPQNGSPQKSLRGHKDSWRIYRFFFRGGVERTFPT